MAAYWKQNLDAIIDGLFDQMVGIRRHLHMNPEVSGQERQTSFYLYQLLGDQGFDVRMGPEGRGVVADSVVEGSGRARGLVALRADIDALRIHDEKEVPYRSRCDGVMHACGHDAHTATVFGATVALRELQQAEVLPWPIRLRAIFQPAEETATGAREMVGVGAMDDVDAILAVHVDPTRPLGKIGVRPGVFTANCDEIDIHIIGRGGHAARPHEASDPIAAAAQLINSLYLFVPRATDSQESVVITIGQVTGGHTANVIPEEVILRGTIRTLDRQVRAETFRHIERLAEGIGRMSDTRIHVEAGLSTHSVVNDPELVDLMRMATLEVAGPDSVQPIPRPSMGSEDFAHYMDYAPGAMIRLGCTSPDIGGSPLHAPDFDVDEEALRIGAKVLARAAVYWSEPRRGARSESNPEVANA
jgi:amidohydrolase